MAIKRCPVCSGPIADWAIRAEFSCHHCGWALSANLRRASAWALAVAAMLELAVFAALWFWAESARDALGHYVAVFGVADEPVGMIGSQRRINRHAIDHEIQQ